MFTVSIAPCLKDLSLDDDLGWKVDDGAEMLNRPSSDFQIFVL